VYLFIAFVSLEPRLFAQETNATSPEDGEGKGESDDQEEMPLNAVLNGRPDASPGTLVSKATIVQLMSHSNDLC
jgi:hypothetical protein